MVTLVIPLKDDINIAKTLASQLKLPLKRTDESYVLRGGDGRRMSEAEAPGWLEAVAELEHEYGADADRLNLAAHDTQHWYSGSEVIFPGGYAGIFKGLSGEYDLRLGQAVRKIKHGRGSAEITLFDGRRATFDAVVVTLPLGVLKKNTVRFDPPLPQQKQRAIKRLGMGVLDKVYLKFDHVFWDADHTWILTPETGMARGQFNAWLNMFKFTGQPVILAFNAAGAARKLSGLSDGQVVQRAVSVLSDAYR